jgi:hypothetical protein
MSIHNNRYVLALLLGSAIFASRANAALTLTIDSYTTDEITFSISGTFDADTIGESPGYLAIKNNWSNNQGVNTQWFTSQPIVTSNTILIGGSSPVTSVQDGTATWQDNVFFDNPLGTDTPIAAGTAVSGSVTLTAAGAFNPADAATLQLISGFSRPIGAEDWVRLEAGGTPVTPTPAVAVPTTSTYGLLFMVFGLVVVAMRRLQAPVETG